MNTLLKCDGRDKTRVSLLFIHIHTYISITVWNLQTGKCVQSFRHKYPVSAVALDSDLCVSGDEGIPNRTHDPSHKEGKGGEVRVWNIKNGDHIKVGPP